MKSARFLLALTVASLFAGAAFAGDKPATTEKPACCVAAEKEGKKCEKCAKAAADKPAEKACCAEAAKAGKACEHCKK